MERGEAKAWAQSKWGADGFAWRSRWALNVWKGECRVGKWPSNGDPKTMGGGHNWVDAINDAMMREGA